MRVSLVRTCALVSVASCLTLAALAQDAGSKDPRRCLKNIDKREDSSFRGLVQAETDRGELIVRVNPREVSRSLLSPRTLDFLYQRECAAAELNYLLPHQRRLIELQERLDCRAISTLIEEFGFDHRDLLTIERDLQRLGGGDWPDTLGPIRKIGLERCL